MGTHAQHIVHDRVCLPKVYSSKSKKVLVETGNLVCFISIMRYLRWLCKKFRRKFLRKKKADKLGQEERVPDVNNVLEAEMYQR